MTKRQCLAILCELTKSRGALIVKEVWGRAVTVPAHMFQHKVADTPADLVSIYMVCLICEPKIALTLVHEDVKNQMMQLARLHDGAQA